MSLRRRRLFSLCRVHPMARLHLPTLLLISLTACGTTTRELDGDLPELAAMPVQSSAEIAGRWDVVSFEGYQPAHSQGATPAAFANFSGYGVSLRIECNHSSVSGVVRDGRFVPQPGLRMQTQMGCGPEREERDRRYFSFFDRSPTVERLANGRLRLIAGESALILERPEQRRLAFLPKRDELDGRWRMDSLTRYGPHGGYSGIGLSDIPGRLVIDGNRLSYDRCPQYDLTFSYSADGRLLKTGGAPLPEKAECAALKLSWETRGVPTPDQILPLLHGGPWVEDVGNGRMLIANEQLGLLVVKVP